MAGTAANRPWAIRPDNPAIDACRVKSLRPEKSMVSDSNPGRLARNTAKSASLAGASTDNPSIPPRRKTTIMVPFVAADSP